LSTSTTASNVDCSSDDIALRFTLCMRHDVTPPGKAQCSAAQHIRNVVGKPVWYIPLLGRQCARSAKVAVARDGCRWSHGVLSELACGLSALSLAILRNCSRCPCCIVPPPST
jgi:hypothetical protein